MDSMAIMAEKDNANQACFGALSGKTTLANEGMSNLQGDPAVAERINALMEGDPSVATSKHALGNGMSDTTGLPCPPDCVAAPGSEHIYHVHLSQSQIHNASNSHTGDMQVIAAVPVYVYLDDTANKVQKRSRKEAKGQYLPSRRRVSKLPRKGRQNGREDLSKEVVKTLSEWTGQAMAEGGEDLSKQVSIKFEWKNRDVGLNQVTFDEATMPAPVCSCTGAPQRCYKWGNGGWQSACCTPSISMYPLPFLPIKRHGRVNGRKMSGSAFTKLLSRMAAEGHDLSTPLDLKDHWAKHGTNGWITIK